MSATSDILVSREGITVVRERSFSPDDLQRLMLLLQEERATGTILLDINQGGVRNVRFREEQAIRGASFGDEGSA